MSIEVKIGKPEEVQNEENKSLGLKALVVTDAPVLINNPEHKNFTRTGEVIPQGSVVYGKIVNINGLRKGEPFQYRIFITEDNKIIHLKTIKPMQTTEVTLGADAKQSPTVVDMAKPKKNFTKYTIGGALVLGGAGWYYSKKMKGMSNQSVMLFTIGGAIAGFFVGKMLEKRTAVVKPSK